MGITLQKIKVSRMINYITLLMIVLSISGCHVSDSDSSSADAVFEFDFRESQFEWDAFFTNYNVDNEDGMELQSGYNLLPEPLNTDDRALYISAVNESDDVKMMFRRQVTGLEPNATYDVQFRIRFATSVPSGCVGIGGPPGEAVRVIADASTIRPEAVVENGYYLLNTQQMSDPTQWYQNVQMGNIANSRECEDGYEYELKELESEPEHSTATADASGALWLMFGTRSGFEGQTELYYTYAEARLNRDI